MALSHVMAGAITLAVTSCVAHGIELQLEPRPDRAEITSNVLAYLDRAASRYGMQPIYQSDLACRHAWRTEGRPRAGIFRAPVLIVCSDYQSSGPIDVRLYYDGSWDDSTAKAVRIRRELTDSLARFGVLTVRDSASSLLTTR